ncbi:hypothetical protein OAG68_02645 [bacterium]|nr:hypothetical protein [bacterium]
MAFFAIFVLYSGETCLSQEKESTEENEEFDRFFKSIDRDGDGKIQRSEVPDENHSDFDSADANGDQVVTREELRIAFEEAEGDNDRETPNGIRTKYYYGIGNPESETVVINTQGGPMPELLEAEFAEVFAGVDLNEAFVVNVHQAHTLHPEKINQRVITFEEAIACDAESTKILAEVVDEFLRENKRVYVVGISFGAWMVQDLLATQGSVADGYLILVGRLDMTEEIWQSFSKGGSGYFENGDEPTIEDAETFDGQELGPREYAEQNIPKIAAGLGHKRYTKLLKDVDLSKVTYIYGKRDEAVGRLSESELEFLKQKGVKTISTEGGHGNEEIDDYMNEILNEFITRGKDLSGDFFPPEPAREASLSLDTFTDVLASFGFDDDFETQFPKNPRWQSHQASISLSDNAAWLTATGTEISESWHAWRQQLPVDKSWVIQADINVPLEWDQATGNEPQVGIGLFVGKPEGQIAKTVYEVNLAVIGQRARFVQAQMISNRLGGDPNDVVATQVDNGTVRLSIMYSQPDQALCVFINKKQLSFHSIDSTGIVDWKLQTEEKLEVGFMGFAENTSLKEHPPSIRDFRILGTVDRDEPENQDDEVELVGEARMIMALLDVNGDSKLQESELEGDAKSMLREVDQNEDGVISAKELAAIADEPRVDVHSKLVQIDTHQNPMRIVELPGELHEGINQNFAKYTNVLAPNGKPIHILAMDGWSDDRILRARKVLEHFLTNVPNRKWGEKTAVANTMADNHATLVLLNHNRDMDRVMPALEGTNLECQDLRANESPFEGEADYMKHETRDAAYEEVFHLIHGKGVIFAMKEYDREIRELAKSATDSDLWNFDEPNMPGSHFEYIICVFDNYVDLWKTAPTKMEGRRIPAQRSGESFNGEYKAFDRASTMKADPLGFAMLEKFNPKHIAYSAELPTEFKGTFSLDANGGQRYSEKSKYLLNVTLRGINQSNLTGNTHNNRLVGNEADNVLTGNGGDDSLFGGTGQDTAVFRGERSQYTIRRLDGLIEVHDSMVNRDGYDVLSGIEILKFSDTVVEK